MPAILEPIAAAAKARHRHRHANPGVAVEVEKVGSRSYVLASPHRDVSSWQAMVCDALGTRSEATAQTFLLQLTGLCQQHWHPAEGEEPGTGEWLPDERELNLLLNMVAGIRPKNEMEAALAAQMVAVHLMQMRVSARALGDGYVIAQDAAIAGKLARTFVMQIEALAKLKGRKTTRQTITVRHEKHVHTHQHVHLERGASDNDRQAHEPCDDRNCGNNWTEQAGPDASRAALPGPDASGVVVPMPRKQGEGALPAARRSKWVGGSER